jgi:NADPH:quinone reductase-like Zn-dependent oxidoreductase
VAGFQAGDRVAAFTQGAFATRARAKASFAFKIPRYISLEAAASLPLAYSTAYYSLVELGRLGEGETVLIHSAAGAVGQAAICVAQMIGAEVFATVGNAEKKRLLLKEYGLQEDHIFYSRNNSFADAIRHATNGQGIDVILNSLTGDGFRESWKCLNKFGRFIEIGKRESGSKARLDVDSMDSNASFISLDMFTLIAERPKIVKRLLADVAQVLKYGKIRPVTPVMQFAISDVEAALKAQQTGNMMGKLVVVPRATDVVKVRSFQSQLIRRSVTNTRITGGKIEEGKATSSP